MRAMKIFFVDIKARRRRQAKKLKFMNIVFVIFIYGFFCLLTFYRISAFFSPLLSLSLTLS